MEDLTPLAQVCITLIDSGNLDKDQTPFLVKEEVENYYIKQEGEDENNE